jgi:hypothetical protein
VIFFYSRIFDKKSLKFTENKTKLELLLDIDKNKKTLGWKRKPRNKKMQHKQSEIREFDFPIHHISSLNVPFLVGYYPHQEEDHHHFLNGYSP